MKPYPGLHEVRGLTLVIAAFVMAPLVMVACARGVEEPPQQAGATTDEPSGPTSAPGTQPTRVVQPVEQPLGAGRYPAPLKADEDAKAPSTQEPNETPNIVVIWGDDIGLTDISAYSKGMLGFQTPNIDRIAHEGMIFTDYYGEQSCTAGRSAFITGQTVIRTGLSKVGLPGADLGLRKEDPTIAALLKNHGYATGQFGKNHLGDKDPMLPTNHGFDEFYGNLYHLNAEEEPELPDYPQDPEFRRRFGPRGVIHSFSDGRIEDTGPLTKKRMETIDDDIAERASTFIEQSHQAGKPFFVWVNFTHMHFRTHVKPESIGQSGRWQSEYHDAMIDHDRNVGSILETLDRLALTGDTIVLYSTDNGPHTNTWPDAAMTPFRNEKNSNWEGAYRVPAMLRWPGHIEPNTVSNAVISHLDWMPTLLAAVGETDIKDKLLRGHSAIGRKYRVHLDGYDQLPYLTGHSAVPPRAEFFYFNDSGDLVGMRYDNWKLVFMEQRQRGQLAIWAEPFIPLRLPKIFNLRTDPFERADVTSNTYWDWVLDHAFMIVPAQQYVGEFIATFESFPPRQRAASFNLDVVMARLRTATSQ